MKKLDVQEGNKFDDKCNNINYIIHKWEIEWNYEESIKELNKLLNDENYKNYYYLCYFYIGNFYELLNNRKEAIKFLTLSIKLNNNFFYSF